jgi:hypothetical protein
MRVSGSIDKIGKLWIILTVPSHGSRRYHDKSRVEGVTSEFVTEAKVSGNEKASV